jgi:hypothetical protein
MSDALHDNTTLSSSSLKHRAQFRAAGVIVLLLGIGSAWILYWLRTRNQDSSADPMLAGYSKPETRQMEILYGKMGLVTSDLFDALKRPGTQAILIVAISALVAMGCFFFARRWVDGDETG